MSAKLCRRLTLPELLAVHRALAAGVRHVEIARNLDLGIWTVERIADRRRYDLEPSAAELPQDDAPPDYAAANLRRCPACGAMVYVWPCLACRMALRGTREESRPKNDQYHARRSNALLSEAQPLDAKSASLRVPLS